MKCLSDLLSFRTGLGAQIRWFCCSLQVKQFIQTRTNIAYSIVHKKLNYFGNYSEDLSFQNTHQPSCAWIVIVVENLLGILNCTF